MAEFVEPTMDEHLLKEIQRHKSNAFEAAAKCDIPEALKQMQLMGTTIMNIAHPEVTLEGANRMKDVFDLSRTQVADEIVKGCRKKGKW